jgi:ADP-heptose:LPS heptosyltransferase
MAKRKVLGSPKRILIVRPDAIGDVVLMIPMINSLKQTFPDAEIYPLLQPYTQPILENHPSIKEILIDRKKTGEAIGIKGFFSYAKWLKSYRFDAVILPFLDTYYAALTKFAGIPMRVGDSQKILTSLMLTHTVPTHVRDLSLHESEQDTLLLNAFKNCASRLELSDTMDVYHNESDWPEAEACLKEQGWTGQPIIIVHPTTGGGNRPWTSERYAALIDLIHSRRGERVVITGAGKKDGVVGEDISRLCSAPPYSVVNRTSIHALKALISKATLVIGTDTGPTHIAAAMGRPVLCVSPTKFVKSLRWGPWQTVNRIVGNPSKCDVVCYPYKCTLPNCLDSIEPEMAFIELQGVLDKDTADEPVTGQELKAINKRKWIIASTNIGLAITDFNSDGQQWLKAQQAHLGLLRWTNYVLPSWKWWNLIGVLRFIWKHDINIIQLNSPRYTNWFNGVIRQLAALKLYCPPIIVTSSDFENTEDFYLAHFNKISSKTRSQMLK